MSMWLIASIAYLSVAALFLVAWSRGLPPPENNSRAIKRFEQRRLLQRVFWRAYPADPRSSAEFAPLLKKLEASD